MMRIFTFIYFIGAIGFFFLPEETFYLVNIGPRVFKFWEEIPMPSEHFWVTLSTSMMMMLMTTSFYSSLYPKMKGYLLMHMISKVTSISGFIFLFLHDRHYFAYAYGALTDSLVVLIVMGFYLRSFASGEVIETAASPAAMPENATPATATAGTSDSAGDSHSPH
ncbi:MAG: hypothetical protein HY074_15110 [Deltaproteobacteria bacterium]|nr:hypothetical protein [Deltaproteobacteria bacterium]